ncbi:MAG: hypothetical protein K1X65_24915 [Caldilineales bacterium]|nr:hypothetical protein [Caldilineales bacterium]MCW5858612.1 hypothetical protein [Caldilineales bacterium]
MNRRSIVVVSDTHIGAGGRAEGNVRFDPGHPYSPAFYSDPGEAQALQRLEICCERHPGVFLSLRDFLRSDFPRRSLTILFGNHDPELIYPAVQARLAAAPDILIQAEDAPAVLPGPATQAVQRQIEDPATAAALIRRLESDPAFVESFTRQVQAALIEQGMEPPGDVLPAALVGLPPAERARAVEEQYWAQLEGAADEIAQATGARVLLFGHIHARIEKTLPSGALYLNTGTWIWQGDFRRADDAIWQDLVQHPEKYADARDLTFARIDFDAAGQITAARLDRAGPAPTPPAPPGPLPRSGLFTRLLRIEIGNPLHQQNLQ